MKKSPSIKKEVLIEILKAQETLKELDRKESFDPKVFGSKANEAQDKFLKDIGKVRFRVIRAGNQCLAKGTLIRTTTGLIKIEDIKPGMFVYDENSRPIRVLKTFRNGIKDVVSLVRHSQILAEPTLDHVFLGKRNKRDSSYKEFKVREVSGRFHIKKNTLPLPEGGMSVPQAYALGAFLGDGCCTETGLIIASQDEEILSHLRDLLRCGTTTQENKSTRFKKPTWSAYEGALYNRWCKGRLAHEKYCEMEEIKDWDAESKLQFLSGLIDTDGTIYKDRRYLKFKLGMQARSVVDAAYMLILELFQIHCRSYDEIRHYVNGPVCNIANAENGEVKHLLRGLKTRVPSKKWDPSYDSIISPKENNESCWFRVNYSVRQEETYDIHVDSETNLYCLANGLVTHNSGKSTTCARELAWVATETHPKWTRPKDWGTGALTLIIAGQDRKGMELELWNNKLLSYLEKDEWKEHRTGGVLAHVEHLPTGNRIIFLSHSDGSDKARRHMQSYVAHYVWIDEMPLSVNVFEELQRRVQAREGYLVCSFTPKVRNEALRRHIDMLCETSQANLYKLSMLDNPLYKKRKKELLEELESLPESYRNTVLYGDWYTGEHAVYQWDDTMIAPLPETYSPAWRHIEAVDPALKSKMGWTLWAEDPATGTWWLVRDEYIEGIYDPVSIFQECMKRSRGYAVIKRVSDVAPWFQSTAQKEKVTYLNVWNKTQRKEELIKNLQKSMSSGDIKIASHCRNFVDEVTSCQWSDTSDRIVNGQSYHTVDSAQYFVDLKPARTLRAVSGTVDAVIEMQHKERVRQQSMRIKRKISRGTKYRRPGSLNHSM